jgi:hypothetical protein
MESIHMQTLARARERLVREERAATLSKEYGWHLDARVAELNIQTLRQVITALESEEKN